MKRSYYYMISIIALLFLGVLCLYQPQVSPMVRAGYSEGVMAAEWDSRIASLTNQSGISLVADGSPWQSESPAVFMNEERQLMVPVKALKTLFHCNAGVYEQSKLKVYRNTKTIFASLDSDTVLLSGEEYTFPSPFVQVGDEYYVSAQVIAEGLGYRFSWSDEERLLQMADITPLNARLPVSYDGRVYKRVPQVRDQGTLGTCWAFAAVSALEASLLPEETWEFSIDHMSLNNFFGRSQEIGGEYTMAMSYLLAWQGPVLESEDPYGDGKTNVMVQPRKHVQEIQIIPQKDMEGIKEAVYLYGGVQTSLYSALTSATSVSEFYNPETAAYYYVGTEKMNHDVLIVGWDDNYPKENFNTAPEGNGAFLCLNSWGSRFGDDGYFWVSYFDSSIGIYNIVYTGVEEADNYDNIYQSDLCGWIGQLGYGEESAYFANAYTAKAEETLEAVGFYAVGSNTDYEIYLVNDFNGKDDLSYENRVAQGSFSNPGYYTVRLNEAQALKAGEKFAVIIYIRTPGEERPIAVEYNNEEEHVEADLTDGEGYISLKGTAWQSAEENQKCNLCLKVYTKGEAENPKTGH
ncbi:MAG: cell surface protein [Lachnospiraceae bacterium]|nr:cell surface protein [Lachnospiraceae bacterium]